MDNLRWWLLLVVAVLFSMSGCASSQDWAYWREHPTHFASGGHMSFSVKNDNPYYPTVTEADAKQAQAYGWWGDQVPLVPPTDLSGHWVGRWKGLGIFDALREGDVEATLTQKDYIGVAVLKMDNTIAAGVPWVVRYEGSRGVRLVYRVAGNDAIMRYPPDPEAMNAAFTLVNGKLIGTVPDSDSPIVIVLTRQQ